MCGIFDHEDGSCVPLELFFFFLFYFVPEIFSTMFLIVGSLMEEVRNKFEKHQAPLVSNEEPNRWMVFVKIEKPKGCFQSSEIKYGYR